MVRTKKRCACGCGSLPAVTHVRNGTVWQYGKYAIGHRPKISPAVLLTLENGRRLCWKNPAYREKMRQVSSATMRLTNARRRAGEFPSWNKSMSEHSRQLLKRRWRDGSMAAAQHQRFGVFRSKLERKFSLVLDFQKIRWFYEPRTFELLLEGLRCTYTPDFYLPDVDQWIEIKGFWRDEQSKRKVFAFMSQYPNLSFCVLEGSSFRLSMGKEFRGVPSAKMP